MKLENFLISTGKYCMGALVSGSIGACAGYSFGSLSGGNPLLSAQAVAIAAIAGFIFRQCVESGFEELTNAQRNMIYILGASFGGTTLIIALKNLEIISRLGAAILGILVLSINGLALVSHLNQDYLFADP